ncbi:5034_t:CDS:1, partial [Paraglomus brasilianum]
MNKKDSNVRSVKVIEEIRPIEPTTDWSKQIGNRKEENRPDATAILGWRRQKGNRKEEKIRDSSSGGRRQRYHQQDENEDNAGWGWNREISHGWD